MSVVTLTGHMGATGEIGSLLARELGYRLVDRELVERAAALMGCAEGEVLDFDERTGGLVQHLVDFFEREGLRGAIATEPWAAFRMGYSDAAQQALTAGEQYVEALRATIRGLAETGDVVIVGRGAQAILAHWPDTVHIRLACAADERARRIALRSNISVEEAAKRVADSDRGREDWHRRFFGIDYRSPYQYTLMLNTGHLDDSLAASLIAEVVRHPEQRNGLPTVVEHGSSVPFGAGLVSAG